VIIEAVDSQQIAEAPADGRSVMLTALALYASGACTISVVERGPENSSSSNPADADVVLLGPVAFTAAGQQFVLPYNPDGWLHSDIGIRLNITAGAGQVTGLATTRNFRA
jgi:hypothetical protein